MCHQNLKNGFYKMIVRLTMLYGRMLTVQELAHPKDESSENGDAEIDV